MPYVVPGEGLDQPFVDLGHLALEMGSSEWRVPVVGTAGLRVILLHWLPGYASKPHHHPSAEEIFMVLRGQAAFTIGDEPPCEVGPGQFMFARRGVQHAIRVLGDDALVLLAAVAPNEDIPQETIE